jgi:hypothetical protein
MYQARLLQLCRHGLQSQLILCNPLSAQCRTQSVVKRSKKALGTLGANRLPPDESYRKKQKTVAVSQSKPPKKQRWEAALHVPVGHAVFSSSMFSIVKRWWLNMINANQDFAIFHSWRANGIILSLSCLYDAMVLQMSCHFCSSKQSPLRDGFISFGA